MGFKQTGTIKRKFVSPKGNFASIKLTVNNDGRNSDIEFVSFDCVRDIDDLREGAEVTLSGKIGLKKLTSKDKQDVIVDGYPVWVPQLVVTDVSPAGQTAEKPPKDMPDGDDIPF